MGGVAKEEGVLKLVHAGGFVEVRREPVAAARIMEENRRHCVTRPDVFKFPWIVVSPESLLRPGNVFYVVPNRTIYRLLRQLDTPGHPDPSSPSPSPSPTLLRHHRGPRHQLTHQRQQEPLPSPLARAGNSRSLDWIGSPFSTDLDPPSRRSARRHVTAGGADVEEDFSRTMPAMTAVNRGQLSLQGSSVPGYTGHGRNKSPQEPPQLKSCLKKPDAEQRSRRHGLRVRFILPRAEDDDEDEDYHFFGGYVGDDG